MFSKQKTTATSRGSAPGAALRARAYQAKRTPMIEAMEPRLLMAADPLQIGVVYVEEDLGSDLHGDLFYVTFQGGAENTQLSRLTIDGDINRDGFGLGDLFFDTVEQGFGADHAYGFQVESLETANANATVNATVVDGSTKLVLDFTNFVAGDRLVFSIDVDEVQFYDPNETDLDILNENFDPITSGVEFQNSHLDAAFTAPHYEDIDGHALFRNRYDPFIDETGIDLPRDNQDGKRDRTAGAGLELQQQPKPISLAGVVFVDVNEDLVIQTGEQRLSGIQLELFELRGGSFESTGHTTLTDALGRYSFGTDLALLPGTYQIRESQPTGYYSVGAVVGRLNGTSVGETVANNPDILTQIEVLKGDSHATDLNFAENLPGSISGSVCVVVDGYNCFDASSEKAPLEGVLIELRDETGQIVSTTRTGADGSYQFDNLRRGRYSITEITPTDLLDGDSRLGNAGGTRVDANQFTQILVGGGINAADYDFCEITPSEISGYTYYDVNINGIRDPGETPLAGVLVTLCDEDGNLIAEARTDSNGYYKFTGLRPGQYSLKEQTPPGYAPGQAAAGTIRGLTRGTIDTTGDLIKDISLPAGSSGINYDFGEILTGSITGRVYVDPNGDCYFDANGDTPLAGVTIELLDATGSVLQTTITNSNGIYSFGDLLPAVYTLREIQPTGYFQGGQRAGSGGGDASQQDRISAVSLATGEDLFDYDFCELEPGTISGSVFVDFDSDCIQDANESSLSGVEIQLLDTNGTIVATTLTNADGKYSFGNLRPGQYSVREIQPNGYFHGGQVAPAGNGDDSIDDLIRAIGVGSGQSISDANFCEVAPGTISGSVFVDIDFDCVRDANESSLAGVEIQLLDASGTIVATTLTNSDGAYSFSSLRPGQYSVREVQPDGYFHGGQVAPAGNGDSSVSDLIQAISVGSGQTVSDANFCEVPPAEISGYVFMDGGVIKTETGEPPEDIRSVRDGQRTEDDTPIQSVKIQLRTLTGASIDSSRALPGIYDGDVIEVETDANGFFRFTGIRAGSYHIYQIQPEGFQDSLDTPGTTTGFAINPGDIVPSSIMSLIQLSNPGANPGTDAILAVEVNPAGVSAENNFSEVLAVKADTPVPPLPDPPDPPTPVRPGFETFAPRVAIAPAPPLAWNPAPLNIGVGHNAPPTWHLSVINGGYPRGVRNGDPVDEATVEKNSERLNSYAWTVSGMQDTSWRIVSLNSRDEAASTRFVFDLPGATPLAGDFNGDNYDEMALFLDGEWFIDFNGNGRWDEADIWAKLGTTGDQPVVGDWDQDGKDDIGIFGKPWRGDERALANETGLPDPENDFRVKAKNVPPTVDEAPEDPRLLKRSARGQARADLIDHVFRFGGGKDIAVSGDFNGDGVSTIGVFKEGKWILDIDGDGQLSKKHDRVVEFGKPGDIPVVGDFDRDGIDELAIVRGNQVIVDSDGNGRIDATDQVFLLESAEGTVIVGDFNGDGYDEPALHQSSADRTMLEARRAQ